MLPTRSSRILAVMLALAATACDGPKTTATLRNSKGTFSLFAVTGAPSSTNTALTMLYGPTRADGNFAFDIAVDMDNAGTTRLYPVRLLAGGLAGQQKRVGLQKVTGAFEDLLEAPESGYDTLSAPVVVPGSVIAVETIDVDYCRISYNGYTIYGKLVIDSIRTDTRRVVGRLVTDRNCGFRGLVADSLPER